MTEEQEIKRDLPLITDPKWEREISRREELNRAMRSKGGLEMAQLLYPDSWQWTWIRDLPTTTVSLREQALFSLAESALVDSIRENFSSFPREITLRMIFIISNGIHQALIGGRPAYEKWREGILRAYDIDLEGSQENSSK